MINDKEKIMDFNNAADVHLRILEKESIECEDIKELLCDYVDDDLPQALRARVSQHICNCPVCEEEESSYRNVIDLAKELREEETEISEDVQRRLREALNARLGLNL